MVPNKACNLCVSYSGTDTPVKSSKFECGCCCKGFTICIEDNGIPIIYKFNDV